MLNNTLKALALAAGMIVPGIAAAQSPAVVTTDLNIRTGPGTSYQRFGTIPGGDEVLVFGCLGGYNWCDVNWDGTRGWVSGSYLASLGERYYRRPLSTVGISVGVPVITFEPYAYHRRYYSDRAWYRDRYLDRREVRRDRRELRDAVRDVRRERRDVREARQELRQERRRGGDIRAERRELRQERRDLRDARRDRRQERRD